MVNWSMTKEPKVYNGGKIVSSVNGGGKTGKLHAKNDTGPLFYTVHKNQLKKNWRLE